MLKITPILWVDTQAGAVAKVYTSIFQKLDIKWLQEAAKRKEQK